MSRPSRTFSLGVRPEPDACSSFCNPYDVLDQLVVLRRLESTTYRRGDYMAANASLMRHVERTQNPVVNDECRQTLVQLLYRVADHCEFRRDTVSYAMINILDRFLATNTIWARSALTNRLVYQLAAMTALHLAVKTLEPLGIDAQCLVDIGRGCYKLEDFVAMERQMLIALKWHVAAGPTPLDFVQQYLSFLTPEATESCDSTTFSPEVVKETMFGPAQYQLELVVAHYDLMVDAQVSELALAAVWNAMEGMDEDIFPLKEQAAFQQRLLNALASIDLDFTTDQMLQQVDELQTNMSVIMLQSLHTEDFKQLLQEKDGKAQQEPGEDEESVSVTDSNTSTCDDIISTITCCPGSKPNGKETAVVPAAASTTATAGNSPISVTECTRKYRHLDSSKNNARRKRTPDTPPLLPPHRVTQPNPVTRDHPGWTA